MAQCQKAYVLADSSKFHKVSSVTFGEFKGATIITDVILPGYEQFDNVVLAKE